jgi:hypothetical protein
MTHHLSLETFSEAVARGCQICVTVANRIDYDHQRHKASTRGKLRIPLQQLRSTVLKAKAKEPVKIDAVGMSSLERWLSREVQLKKPLFTRFDAELVPEGYHALQFSVDQGTKHTSFVKANPDSTEFALQSVDGYRHIVHATKTAPHTGASSCLEQVSHWYTTCLKSHKFCLRTRQSAQSSDPAYLPTRILEIVPGAGTDSIKLLDSSSITKQNHDYMTLSHCWGAVPMLRYTDESEKRLRAGIPVDSLPKTFRDAVQVVKYLQCSYIWIDALCIKQDDKEDWAKESTLMETVYSSAICNIGASGSKDSLGGLFFDRNPEHTVPCTFTHHKSRHTSEEYLITEDYTWERSLVMQPLQLRGWALQESILAQRLIYFTNKELMWQCGALAATETYPYGFPVNITAGLSIPFALVVDRAPENDLEFILNSWRGLIIEYSGRLLTYPADKLIAISGLARKFQHLTEHEYLAGLWRQELPQQLLWYRRGRQDKHLSSTRPSEYRVPSWSWAAVDCQILWDLSQGSEELFPTLVEVQKAEVTLASQQDAYGPVTAGYIKLVGTLFPMMLASSKLPPDIDSIYLVDRDGYRFQGLDNLILCYLDSDPDMDIVGPPLFCLPVKYLNKLEPAAHLSGLILKPVTGRKGTFSRVGVYMELAKTRNSYYTTTWGVKPDGEEIIII